jgi:type IV fimbrial biogenesis protein FimT
MRLERAAKRFFVQSGFTLLELLAGCALFGILTAIAVPSFTAVQPSLRLNGAARQAYGRLMWARSQAVDQNNQFIVSLANNHTLSILDDNNGNGSADVGETVTTVDIQLAYPDVTITRGLADPNPTFLGRGTTLGTTNFTVSNSAGSRTITVNITGVIKIN